MNENVTGGRGLRLLKGFLYSGALFFLLTGIMGLLLKWTPLPESGAAYYMIGILALSCLFLGLCAGSAMKKRGLLYGVLCGAVFTLTAVMLTALAAGEFSGLALLQAKYLTGLLCGGIGGLLGVNFGN